jgi:hypothetical protein
MKWRAIYDKPVWDYCRAVSNSIATGNAVAFTHPLGWFASSWMWPSSPRTPSAVAIKRLPEAGMSLCGYMVVRGKTHKVSDARTDLNLRHRRFSSNCITSEWLP